MLFCTKQSHYSQQYETKLVGSIPIFILSPMLPKSPVLKLTCKNDC